MSYNAIIIEVMIASPSDVPSERQIIREILTEWNVVNSRSKKVLLVPIGWETHSFPDLSGRPQQLILDRVLAHADILVGVFWTKLGSPTGKAASGTVEEIEEHLLKGKPAMLYFSDAPAVLSTIDYEQYNKLKDFKDWAKTRGLIEIYESKDQFRDNFRRHIAQILSEILQGDAAKNSQKKPPDLSSEAKSLLEAAIADEDGAVLHRSYIGGEGIYANKKKFNDNSPRSIALWTEAKKELIENGFLVIINETMSKVTNSGFNYFGNLKSQS